MSDDYAIKVENLSKEFKLPHNKKTSLKEAAVSLVKRDNTYEVQQALHDVSFEIKKGEFFGIVGRNGSGKSTLLKIMAGVYTPTSGGVKINGSLVPFIELGVGFNPELSGRDNVFLNGALLGFSRAQMAKMYDEIVEFAELEQFMDQKLKNYSSGMQVRLAFSIAIRAEGDILILDEVLAVGDSAFQKKCIDVFEKYKLNDKTVVLVTHNMSMVEKYCDRALLLSKGKLIDNGDPRKISGKYSIENTNVTKDEKNDDKELKKTLGIKYKILPSGINKKFSHNEKVKIEASWSSEKIKNIGIALVKNSGEYIFGTNTVLDDIKVSNKRINYEIKLNLNEGSYKFVVGFFGKDTSEKLFFTEDNLSFEVEKNKKGWEGITKQEYSWSSDV